MIPSGCLPCEHGSYSETLVDFDVAGERVSFPTPPKDDELLSQVWIANVWFPNDVVICYMTLYVCTVMQVYSIDSVGDVWEV